jgi:hypothetical protein
MRRASRERERKPDRIEWGVFIFAAITSVAAALVFIIICVMLSGCALFEKHKRDLLDYFPDKIKAKYDVDKQPEYQKQTQVFDMRGETSGRITFETHGIVHQRKRNKDGGWEYIVAEFPGYVLVPDGTNTTGETKYRKVKSKLLIYHCGGGGRRGRVYLKQKIEPRAYNIKLCGAWPDHLPDATQWVIEYGDGKLAITYNGKHTRKGPYKFRGGFKKAYVGGGQDARRRFRGTHRNVQIKEGDE